MKKTKNLNEYLKKRKRVMKVVEDVSARDSICSTITGYIDTYQSKNNEDRQIDFFSLKEEKGDDLNDVLSSDILSSDVFSGDIQPSEKIIHSSDDSEETKGEVHKTLPVDETKQDTNIKERINKVKQFTGLKDIKVDNNKIDTYLILPKKFLRLSKIFKALLTVQKYNSLRKLTSIFVKSKGCIERILKTRVEEEDVKRIYYLIPDQLELKRITVEEKGEYVKTFTFKISCEADELDKKLLSYYNKVKQGTVLKEDVEDVPIKEYEIVKKEVIQKKSSPLIVTPPSSPFLSSPSLSTEERAKKKTSAILERIKERERQRKEEFIKNMEKKNEDRDLIKRIEIHFKKEAKKAIKVTEIVKVLEIYDGVKLIKRVVEENPSDVFEIKKISGEEYLVYKK